MSSSCSGRLDAKAGGSLAGGEHCFDYFKGSCPLLKVEPDLETIWSTAAPSSQPLGTLDTCTSKAVFIRITVPHLTRHMKLRHASGEGPLIRFQAELTRRCAKNKRNLGLQIRFMEVGMKSA